MYEDIKEQFSQVILESQGIEPLELDELFNTWAKQKQKFINRFGGLIYEFGEVEFTLTEEDKKSKIDGFITELNNDSRIDLANFIVDNVDSFFNNEVSCANKNYPEIKPGMKLVKSFKYFEKDKKELANLQDRASQIIQEDKVKGVLCFSVHPLDYLSSSENSYKWTTCHGLKGGRRGGNLSYMLDSTTFLVYIKGENDTFICNFGDVKWNSKKWRVLFHATDDDEVLIAGKQYPFFSKNALDTALNVYNNFIVKELDESEKWENYPFPLPATKYMPWMNDWVRSIGKQHLYDAYMAYGPYPLALRALVKNAWHSLCFCDVLLSTDYLNPYYTVLDRMGNRNLQKRKDNPMYVGHEVKCLRCGKRTIDHHEFMFCDECELELGDDENDSNIVFRCDICGQRAIDGYDVGDGDRVVCKKCYNDYCDYCAKCHKIYILDEEHNCSEEDKKWQRVRF